MKFNITPASVRVMPKVFALSLSHWFKINGCHFIRMGVHDDDFEGYGVFVEDNCRVYDKCYLVNGNDLNAVPCFNLEEQMLVYIDRDTVVDDYGEYEMNLFRK